MQKNVLITGRCAAMWKKNVLIIFDIKRIPQKKKILCDLRREVDVLIAVCRLNDAKPSKCLRAEFCLNGKDQLSNQGAIQTS